jgi:hypothetical protein
MRCRSYRPDTACRSGSAPYGAAVLISRKTAGDLITVLLVGGAILLFMSWLNPAKAGEIVARDAMGTHALGVR